MFICFSVTSTYLRHSGTGSFMFVNMFDHGLHQQLSRELFLQEASLESFPVIIKKIPSQNFQKDTCACSRRRMSVGDRGNTTQTALVLVFSFSTIQVIPSSTPVHTRHFSHHLSTLRKVHSSSCFLLLPSVPQLFPNLPFQKHQLLYRVFLIRSHNLQATILLSIQPTFNSST